MEFFIVKSKDEPANYKHMMKLRSAYAQGINTAETKAAARLYIRLRRHGTLNQFKEKGV